MGLNIVAKRKMSLKGFAEGWDDCYLMIKSANETKRKEWLKSLDQEKSDDETAFNTIRDACLEVIVGGVVMSTDADGNASPVEFTAADVPEVVEAMNFVWQQEAVSVSTGNDRLKAMI
ncbi:hypothetical protein [Arthrobacter sp. EpRS71]|uniref:hypothetical protein n=1 Tax=Arthrobacter sp. EpRS71 TaxID=1743141 RepID=UPI00074780C4|nr:hypothetical protein [Arthrobacter sp. EpRS71]KUM39019.1 hypothetical protein AR689_07645 [Arthrobacter sp. EpRS71]